jgi:acetyltransferase EpsM
VGYVAKKPILIIGSGGHSRVVIDIAISIGFNIIGVIDINYNNNDEENIFDFPVIGGVSKIDNFDPISTEIALAIGNTELRSDYFSNLQNSGYKIVSLISPLSHVSNHVQIGNGVLINTGAIINAGVTVNDNVIINTGAIIEHEVIIGKNTHVGPGVKIGGRVKIGNNSFVGIGSTIKDYINIGDNAQIGAGSVIIRDVESNTIVYGVPGKQKS